MPGTTPTRRPWTAWLKARWPTAVALAIAALLVTVSEIQTDQGVTDLSQAALLLPLEYLVIAKLRRRRASWPVIVALFIPFVALGEQEAVDRAVVVSAVALVVLAADPDLGRHLVAAAWLLHGVWDLVHFRLDTVVVRAPTPSSAASSTSWSRPGWSSCGSHATTMTSAPPSPADRSADDAAT